MVNFELEILNLIRDNLSSPILDQIMIFITHLGSAGLIWIVTAVILLINARSRKTGIKMAAALILSLIVCNIILKPLTARVRPYDMASISLLIAEPMGASFPSGHASSSFAAAVTLLINRNRLGVPAVVLAALISFSRLYLYVHYPSDVLCGALLGTAFAFAADLIVNKALNRKNPSV